MALPIYMSSILSFNSIHYTYLNPHYAFACATIVVLSYILGLGNILAEVLGLHMQEEFHIVLQWYVFLSQVGSYLLGIGMLLKVRFRSKKLKKHQIVKLENNDNVISFMVLVSVNLFTSGSHVE